MKSIFKSKTFWMGVATAVIPAVVPSAQEAIALHPQVAAALGGVAAILMRLVTEQPVTILPKPPL